MTEKRPSHLRLLPNPEQEPKEEHNGDDEITNTVLKAVLIGVGIGGGIEALVTYFPSDIVYLTRGDFVYRLITAAATAGLLIPLQEKGIKEGEEPRNYVGKAAVAAIGYAVATTMMYGGIEIMIK